MAFAFFFGDLETLTTDHSLLFSAFFLGVRFDLIPLAYINLIPFLLINIGYLIPRPRVVKWLRTGIVGFVWSGYFLLMWIYIFDYGFYSYFQDHLNVLVFGFIEDDTRAVLLSIWKNYNLPLWLSLVFLLHYVFFQLVKLLFSLYDFDLKVRQFDFRVPLTFILGCFVLTWCGRGSFHRLPLSIEDAYISSNSFINKLSLNGAIALNRAIRIRKTFGNSQFNYLKRYGQKDWQEVYSNAFSKPPQETLLKSLRAVTPFNAQAEKKPAHVVMIVMESFGSFWNNRDGEDFNLLGELKPHFDSGLLFNNFLSAENGTIGSIVAVATSQVLRPGARYLSESEFMSTAFSSAAHLPYLNAGYDTHFIYGGKLGWRDLGKFLSVQKYHKLWGAEEILESMPELKNKISRDIGNEWGIFDEYLYSFIEKKLNQASRPQFFMVLTTSNHPPFEYPTSYRPLQVTLTPETLQGITVDEDLASKRFYGFQYANQKIGEFLTRVKKSPLRDNTVVALTGDHSYWIAKGVGHDQEFRRYAVPFYISLPENLKPKFVDTDRFGSHEDIFPTLYHLTLSNTPYTKLGEDMLDEESIAINNAGVVANKDGAYFQGKYWKWKDQKNQILEPAVGPHNLIKLKHHYEAMISVTDLYIKGERAAQSK